MTDISSRILQYPSRYPYNFDLVLKYRYICRRLQFSTLSTSVETMQRADCFSKTTGRGQILINEFSRSLVNSFILIPFTMRVPTIAIFAPYFTKSLQLVFQDTASIPKNAHLFKMSFYHDLTFLPGFECFEILYCYSLLLQTYFLMIKYFIFLFYSQEKNESNCRPISILSNIFKLYERRMEDHNQAGFHCSESSSSYNRKLKGNEKLS